MNSDDIQILELVRHLLHDETLDLDEVTLDKLSQLSMLSENNVSSNHNHVDPNIPVLLDRIAYLEEQLESTVNMTEMTINALSKELEENKNHIPKPEPVPSPQPQITQSPKFLSEILFTTEYQLKAFLPQSFFLTQSEDDMKGSFIWVREKMGLVYLVYGYCEGENRSDRAIMINFITNNLILESRLMDACAILEEMDRRTTQVFNKYQEAQGKIQYCVCVIDKMNSKLDFAGAQMNLIAMQQSGLNLYNGMPALLGDMNISNEKCNKQSLRISRGNRFYIIPQASLLQEQVMQKIQELNRTDFTSQKSSLTEWLEDKVPSANLNEYFISGFGF